VCYAAFARVEGDGFHTATGAAGCYSVTEFVEGYYEHLYGVSYCLQGWEQWGLGGGSYLEGPKRVLDIRYVPEERDDCDVENDYAQRYSLRVVHGQTTS